MFKLNGWTVLFAVLLLINLITVIYVARLSAESPGVTVTSQPAAQGKNTLTLQPEVVNHYLQQENTQAMKLSLTGEQLQIVQYSDFLSQKIKTNILTTPVVIGHNKLRLDINDVAVAGLPLSKKQTLNLIRRFGSLPDNVVLDVNKECFYYDMAPIELGGTALDLTHINQTGWHFNITIEE
ncbi:DUF2140 family protein [Macrococcus equipercicus]|uniref:DUF2140 family protein n=1 Tax=Macrococcus equipercicus TaxID=69967 RepID=A0A9Q9BP37_9STAP|nr:DUF2140 family protein [Macrococcus equipercicus]UTH12829.1 DUF2140 family protein [Macrococcus equipercicus]